jgi:hypothetical protein
VSAYDTFADLSAGTNPFPGLRPFEPEEDYLFFGRERQTDELLRKLRTTRFLSILGRSGSGKSSIVRSGLIPSLWGGGMTHAGSRWRVVIMRPGEDPLGNLAAALSERGVLFDEERDENLTRAFFETTLRASRMGIVECIRQSRLAEGNNVLVLVDQFEEIFRYKRSRRVVGRDEASAFVKLLLAARESELPCYVAITMRSDFIGDCMEFGQLPEVINDGLYLVPRMTRDELKSAITGPVGVGGAAIAPRLVSRLLNHVGDDPDQLPILQHALMRTWERWESEGEKGPLDLAQYDAIGTMESALSRHAEECFSELDARGQVIAEKLFKALTDKGSDVRGVRRPAPVSEICALSEATLDEVTAVVDTFRRPGRSFLMPPAGVTLRPDSILDISHESLMRVWDRLAGWADEEARSGQLYLNVARAAQRHEEGVAALWRDPELQLALTWRDHTHPTEEWAGRYDPSFPRAMSFLDASKTERDRDALEKETRRRQQLRRARALVAIFSVVSVIMLALGAFALSQKNQAEEHQRLAEQEEKRAQTESQIARSERAKAISESARAERERTEADQQRRNAVQQSQVALQQRARAETESERAETERLKAEANAREAQTKKLEAEKARAAAEKATTAAVAARSDAQASETRTKRLSNLAAARALALSILQPKEDPPTSALLALEVYRLNHDNGGNADDPDVFTALRTARERLRPASVVKQQSNIRAMAVSADSRNAFAAGDDGRILRIDLAHGGSAVAIGTAAGPVRSVALGGHFLATAGDIGTIEIRDLRNPNAPPHLIGAGPAGVSAIAFAPAGGKLASASLDGTVKLWDVDGSGSAVTLPGSTGRRITAVAFSPDGKMIAAGRAQGGAVLWHVGQPAEAPLALFAGVDVRSIAFRPDGKLLVGGSGRGEIVQAPIGDNSGSPPPPMLGHVSSVNALSFSRDGKFLASASSDSTVRLWNMATANTPPIVLPGHQAWVWTVAFTPDGERLVSGGEDRTIRIWPAHASLLANDLCAAVSTRKSELTEKEWTKYMPNVDYRPGSPCREKE